MEQDDFSSSVVVPCGCNVLLHSLWKILFYENSQPTFEAVGGQDNAPLIVPARYGFVVGTQTFGKGSVQEVIPLREGGALRLTTSLYFLPKDTCIQGKGIEPDFIIEDRPLPSETVKWMTDHYGRESALKGSIKPIVKNEIDKKKKKDDKKNKHKDKPWKEKRKEWLANNYLFQTTINLIDLLTIGKKANQTMTSYTAQRAFLKENYLIDKPITLQEI